MSEDARYSNKMIHSASASSGLETEWDYSGRKGWTKEEKR